MTQETENGKEQKKTEVGQRQIIVLSVHLMSQTRIQGIHHIPMPQHSTIPAIPETNASSAKIVQKNNPIIGMEQGRENERRTGSH